MNTKLSNRIGRLTAASLLGLAVTVSALAQTSAGPAPAGKAAAQAAGKDDPHRRDDIARHRQMARAHEEAARCLESGEKESACQERLREACKGVGVGRYCGMRHSH